MAGTVGGGRNGSGDAAARKSALISHEVRGRRLRRRRRRAQRETEVWKNGRTDRLGGRALIAATAAWTHGRWTEQREGLPNAAVDVPVKALAVVEVGSPSPCQHVDEVLLNEGKMSRTRSPSSGSSIGWPFRWKTLIMITIVALSTAFFRPLVSRPTLKRQYK